MRVTMLSKAVVVGAYQRKLEELARMPAVDLTVIAPRSWRDSRGETPLERVFTQGYRLLTTPIVLNGHFHAHFYPLLGEELGRSQPQVLHVDEEPYNLAAWQAISWARRNGVPAVFFTWQNLYRRYPPPFNWMERLNYRHAAHAIAGNREATAVLRAKGFSRPITVIPQFGVDPELFRPRSDREAVAAPGLVVGYAGGLVPEKGVDDLLRAVAMVNQMASTARQPAWKIREVRLAGSGSQQLALRDLAAGLGLAERVTFLERLPSTQMPDFYAGLDVLVLPSHTLPNWKEQFGRVLIEAMACQVPVIGSDSGEIPQVIGDAGLVFPEGDYRRLAVLLFQLAQEPVLRCQLGTAGRLRVLCRYTQERVARSTFEVYHQMLGLPARYPREMSA